MKAKRKVVPQICRDEYGQDLDGCSRQSLGGCNKCIAMVDEEYEIKVAGVASTEELEKRYGKFRLDARLLNDEPERVMTIMGAVMVTRAEKMYHNNTIEYIALSPYFEIANPFCEIPEYIVQVTDYKNGLMFIKFLREV